MAPALEILHGLENRVSDRSERHAKLAADLAGVVAWHGADMRAEVGPDAPALRERREPYDRARPRIVQRHSGQPVVAVRGQQLDDVTHRELVTGAQVTAL